MRIAALGGGPASAAAALRLAIAGAEPTLFLPERPGEKPCGGALPDYLLDEIGGFEASGLEAVEPRRAVLENAAGQCLEIDLRGLRIFRRIDFDRALVDAAEAAGARIHRQKVRRIERDGDRPRLATDSGRYTFDWVVAGDGARGLSRRTLGLASRGESTGLGASIDGVAAEELVLGFPGAADAYQWIFPRPGGCSVGIAYSTDELSHGAAAGRLDTFLDRHLGLRWGACTGHRYRYPIPVFGDWVRGHLSRGLEGQLLLAGDAASLADPLTREGIRYAVRSGRWAAEALLEERPGDYVERVLDEVGADLERASRARELFFEDPIGEWMVPVSRYHRGVRRVLTDLLACRQPYRGLRRRLLAAAVGFRRRSDSPVGRAP